MAFIKGQMAILQEEDENGNPLVDGSLEFFVSGTTTPQNAYKDSSGTVLGTSCTLNNFGRPEDTNGDPVDIYFDDQVDYKIVKKDANGTVIDPVIDPFRASGVGIPSLGFGSKGDADASFTLAPGDSDSEFIVDRTTSFNITIPPNSSAAFSIGATITFFCKGASSFDILRGSGVSLFSYNGVDAPASSNKRLSSGGICTIKQIAIDEWAIFGNAGLSNI